MGGMGGARPVVRPDDKRLGNDTHVVRRARFCSLEQHWKSVVAHWIKRALKAEAALATLDQARRVEVAAHRLSNVAHQ